MSVGYQEFEPSDANATENRAQPSLSTRPDTLRSIRAGAHPDVEGSTFSLLRTFSLLSVKAVDNPTESPAPTSSRA